MSEQTQQRPGPWSGLFGRITRNVYWVVVTEIAFVLASLPGIAGLVLLEPHPSNIPLFALSLVPVGPAFAAAITTFRARQRDDDLVVWPRFWRSWWRDLRDVLFVWVPVLAVLTVLGMNIAFGQAVGAGGIFAGISIVLSVVVSVIAVNALVVVALFGFRTRDVWRLSIYYLGAKPLVALSIVSGLVLVAALAWFTTPWILVVIGSLLAAAALANARKMVADIEERFTSGDGADASKPA
ncbi:DUF624 domain-containing protein [Agromyces protaetiae]|uniref:DUF624 domain-containing protein n=1 Tax=Agromyces protaetiae TaxID=2509455 RepID=A0A4P6F8X2_9MICO|nr:DUF624 domain-containing protein [Agromyces protaetiae]QAY72302.1 DUF624 domain-containing protein [Agromyces protaetiae]